MNRRNPSSCHDMLPSRYLVPLVVVSIMAVQQAVREGPSPHFVARASLRGRGTCTVQGTSLPAYLSWQGRYLPR